jgi:hypothetical protein
MQSRFAQESIVANITNSSFPFFMLLLVSELSQVIDTQLQLQVDARHYVDMRI